MASPTAKHVNLLIVGFITACMGWGLIVVATLQAAKLIYTVYLFLLHL